MVGVAFCDFFFFLPPIKEVGYGGGGVVGLGWGRPDDLTLVMLDDLSLHLVRFIYCFILFKLTYLFIRWRLRRSTTHTDKSIYL